MEQWNFIRFFKVKIKSKNSKKKKEKKMNVSAECLLYVWILPFISFSIPLKKFV